MARVLRFETNFLNEFIFADLSMLLLRARAVLAITGLIGYGDFPVSKNVPELQKGALGSQVEAHRQDFVVVTKHFSESAVWHFLEENLHSRSGRFVFKRRRLTEKSSFKMIGLVRTFQKKRF